MLADIKQFETEYAAFADESAELDLTVDVKMVEMEYARLVEESIRVCVAACELLTKADLRDEDGYGHDGFGDLVRELLAAATLFKETPFKVALSKETKVDEASTVKRLHVACDGFAKALAKEVVLAEDDDLYDDRALLIAAEFNYLSKMLVKLGVKLMLASLNFPAGTKMVA